MGAALDRTSAVTNGARDVHHEGILICAAFLSFCTHETKLPVSVGDRSVAVSEARCHRSVCVFGSKSNVPPPTCPSTTPSGATCPAGRRSPVGVADTDAVERPRHIDTVTSSSARCVRREVSVSENFPAR